MPKYHPQTSIPRSTLVLLLLIVLCVINSITITSKTTTTTTVNAFSFPTITSSASVAPPILGIGAILLKPKNTVSPSYGDDDILVSAARCFTDAFWNGKTGGGVKQLSSRQSKSLTKQQITEFRRRYGYGGTSNNNADRRSELVVCQKKSNGQVMGCAGIEVSKISTPNGKSVQLAAPLMSNLAVGKKFRRRGLAEDLVRAAEDVAYKQWGYDECYLYVEKQNAPAVRLYKKLGYVRQWEDDTATTLIPTERGSVVSASTTIICMKKRLGRGLVGRLLPFL